MTRYITRITCIQYLLLLMTCIWIRITKICSPKIGTRKYEIKRQWNRYRAIVYQHTKRFCHLRSASCGHWSRCWRNAIWFLNFTLCTCFSDVTFFPGYNFCPIYWVSYSYWVYAVDRRESLRNLVMSVVIIVSK